MTVVAYPSLDDVEQASKVQLGRWMRFLPSPGFRAISDDDFETVLAEERSVMDAIMARFKSLGGWDTSTSRSVGW